MEKLKFQDLGLSVELCKAVADMGFEEASHIQSAAIPLLLEGADLIGQAHTGTGKTAAFAIPVIEKIDPENDEVQAIVLCPTRELAVQVAEEFRKLLKYKKNIEVVAIYGGQDIERQFKSLRKGAQIVIGTPGRIMDHLRRRSLDLNFINFIVLDEADEMLDMGFRDDISEIISKTPEKRQTIMFSATMDKSILEIAKKYQNNPKKVDVTQKQIQSPKIQQIYFEVLDKNKTELLARLIDIHNIKVSLVFCNTKNQVNVVVEALKSRGYFAEGLHGDLNQSQREKVMNGFRKGTVEILVATDVAGRGIDVNNVEAVFNYDLPRDIEDYIHRIGRTGRAGKTGTAYSFVSGKGVYNLKKIEKINGFNVQRQSVPTISEIEASKMDVFSVKIKEMLSVGHIGRYVDQVEMLMGDDYTSMDVAAALLKIILEKESQGYDNSINFDDIPKSKDNDDFEKRKPRRNGTRNQEKSGDNYRNRDRDRSRSKNKDDFSQKSRRPNKSNNKFSKDTQLSDLERKVRKSTLFDYGKNADRKSKGRFKK